MAKERKTSKLRKCQDRFVDWETYTIYVVRDYEKGKPLFFFSRNRGQMRNEKFDFLGLRPVYSSKLHSFFFLATPDGFKTSVDNVSSLASWLARNHRAIEEAFAAGVSRASGGSRKRSQARAVQSGTGVQRKKKR